MTVPTYMTHDILIQPSRTTLSTYHMVFLSILEVNCYF